MSKITSVTAILLVILTGMGAFAQNIEVAGGQLYVSGTITSNRLEAGLYIQNSSNDDLAVLLDCDVSEVFPSHRAYYCWALCYDTMTYGISPDPLVLPASTIDSTSFHSYIYTHNTAGTSRVSYTFFDQNNTSDSSKVTITYDVLTTGISSLEKKLYTLGTPSPNPANNFTSLTYSMPSSQNASVVIRDLLGKIIQEFPLSVVQGVIIIPTSDLSAGIYNCSLVNAGNTAASVKLVVAHR